ncbi:MAG: RNA polymerase sigma-70 factor [Gemmatimonadetes bacterium]|nr:RNA polymerase sigma-70 factor [Gemmatimonadota bacterium]
MDDRERLERLRTGDLDAFEALFRTYHARLCAWAERTVRAPDVAEEIVQDVFARLWADRRRLAIHTSLRAWLFTAVRNRALNHVRSLRIERVRQGEAAQGTTADSPPDAVRQVELGELAAHLDRALESLPEGSREVIELRWRHQLGHAEIAETLGISRKGVEIRITRALRALREVLGEPPA